MEWRSALAGLGLILLLAACTPSAGTLRAVATAVASATTLTRPPATTAHPVSSTASPSARAGSAPAGGAPVVAQGPGWSGGQLFGPLPAPGSCHEGHEGNQVLPDHHCTPGAIDPRVTQATLKETICRAGGYTASVRPPAALTEKAKRALLAAYGLTGAPGEYELDHLVPLEAGGASDVRNLWPEQNIGSPHEVDPHAEGLNAKDGVEGRLHEAICAGQVSLAAAQQAIAADWTTALARLGIKA